MRRARGLFHEFLGRAAPPTDRRWQSGQGTFFGLSVTISSPLLLAGGALLAVMSLTGSAAIGKAKHRGRTQLAERIKRSARSAIFGDGRNPSDRCVVSDTQAEVLKAAQNTLDA